MREGWEIIPFEKSIQKVKYTTKVPSSDYLPVGAFPIVSQEEGLISGYWNNEADVFHHSRPVVIFGDHTRIIKYVDFDFVLGADGVKILLPIERLSAKFLSYFLRWYKVPSLGYSRHFKLLKEVQVPVPSVQEQEKIVAELDCLSGIIEKKRQQLEELDKLAQSIFYDMFGDPITNEKGWEVKKVIDVVSLQRGYDLPVQSRIPGGVPVYGSNGVISFHNASKVDKGIITGRSGTLGLVYSSDKPFWPLNTTLFSTDTHNNNLIYLQFLLTAYNLKRFGEGAGVPTLNRNAFHNEPIINVNIDRQNEFAKKIEAIEKQKELVKRSIVETETLFNSRMDFWFNN